MMVSCWILPKRRNVSDKGHIETQNTHFMFSNFSENCSVCEIMWKKYGGAGEATDDIIWHMHFECWITKTANTHIFITFNTFCFCTTTVVT
jgi:hypothetical protein